MTQKRQKR